MIRTRITEMFGLRLPVVMGALQWLSRPSFVAAVARAGGLAFLPAASYQGKADLKAAIEETQDLCQGRPFGVNVSMLPHLAEGEKTLDYFEAVVETGVKAVETSGRSPEAYLPHLHRAGVKVIHKVPAVRFALKAEKVGADAVTVVGFECGGHPGLDEVTSLILVPQAAASLKIPVLAGGGFGDGHSLAAALCLGAEGVVMGTRFLMTQESPVHPDLKKRLLQAQETDTTLILKSIRNTARVFRNRAAGEIQAAEARGACLEEIVGLAAGEKGRRAWAEGDAESAALPLGQVIGRCQDLPSVAELMDRLEAQAREALERLGRIVQQAESMTGA